MMPLPEALSGRTFGQAWRSFDCTVIGYLRPGSEPGAAPDVRIGPMDSDVLQPGDALAVIAQDMREAKRVRATQAEVHSFTDVPVKKVQRDPLKIVVAAGPGTDFGRLKPLLSGIAAFAPGGSCVTVLADSVAAAEMRSVSTSNCTFQTLAGFATSRADLLKVRGRGTRGPGAEKGRGGGGMEKSRVERAWHGSLCHTPVQHVCPFVCGSISSP